MTKSWMIFVCLGWLALSTPVAEGARKCSTASPFKAQSPNPPKVTFKKGIDLRFNPAIMPHLNNVATRMKMNVVVSSGFRDECRNRKARGAPRSQHLTGNAVDIRSSSPKSHADSIYNNQYWPGRVLWNTCTTPHVHLDLMARASFNECGTKGNYRRKGKRR